jgi:hypothetical protein
MNSPRKPERCLGHIYGFGSTRQISTCYMWQKMRLSILQPSIESWKKTRTGPSCETSCLFDSKNTAKEYTQIIEKRARVWCVDLDGGCEISRYQWRRSRQEVVHCAALSVSKIMDDALGKCKAALPVDVSEKGQWSSPEARGFPFPAVRVLSLVF